jgi:SPX domain protein involved in polyphosphate accumulation
MWSTLIDSFRIIAASINNPFQAKVLNKHLDSKKILVNSEAFPGLLGNNSDDLKEFNKYLQMQIRILQEMVEKHDKINLSIAYQLMIFFCCMLTVFSFAGAYFSSAAFNDPLTYAQKNFLDICNLLIKTILPALVGLIGGKLIK